MIIPENHHFIIPLFQAFPNVRTTPPRTAGAGNQQEQCSTLHRVRAVAMPLRLLVMTARLRDFRGKGVTERTMGLGYVTTVIRPVLLAGHLKTSTELDCLPVKYFI